MKKKADITIGKTLKMLLSLIWRLDKTYYLVLGLASLAGGLNTIFNIYIPKILIDGYSRGWQAKDYIRVILILGLAKYGLLQLRAYIKRQEKIRQSLLDEKFPIAFANKVMGIDYANLEDAKVLDLKERALFPVTNFGALLQLLSGAVDFLTSLFTVISLVVILVAFSPLFMVLVFFLTLIGLIFSARFMTVLKKITEDLIPINRRYAYYADTATGPLFQKEYRIYGMSSLMTRKINEFTSEMYGWLRNIQVAQANTETRQGIVTGITRFLTYSFVALRVLSDRFGPLISLGDFSVIVAATDSFAVSFRGLVTSAITIGQSISYLKPFCEFMSIPDTKAKSGSLLPEPLEKLAFENVSFSYPNSDRLILDDISFVINRGEKVSIVGLNNAGKTTIVKVICRLFEPDSGRILWNGIDIRDYDYEAYIDKLSCVFQDFQLFPFTIQENIVTQKSGQDEKEEKRLWQVLEEVDMREAVETLPNKAQTYLDKSLYEEATDLSGGQKQKLAIARSIYKESDLVILDEPTAALDPLAESEVYENFNQLVQNRTAIFISHRMSSSIFCDRIILLENGKIAGFDSHEKLMKGHNLYRKLFETQAKNYIS